MLGFASLQSWVLGSFWGLHSYISLMSGCETAAFLVLPLGDDYALSSMPRMLWISWWRTWPRQPFPLSAHINTNLQIESLTGLSVWRSSWEKVKVISRKCLLKWDILIASLSLDNNQKWVLFFIDKWICQNKYGDASMVLGFSFRVKQHHHSKGQLTLVFCNLHISPCSFFYLP